MLRVQALRQRCGTLQALKAKSSVPVLINSCTVDQQFPPEAQETTDKILGNGQYAAGYVRTYWEGCTHGFAVRGDLVSTFLRWFAVLRSLSMCLQSDPKVKAGKEGAFKATVEWFHKYL
jgi:hypothetical protein